MEPTLSRSALRPFDVLEAFRAAGQPLSLSEISRRAQIPLSTCHSVVRALEQRGFLYYLSGHEAYPTRALWDLAREINSNDPTTKRFAPVLGALSSATNETVILGTRQDDKILYLLVVESTQTIRYSSTVGEFKPLHSSAIGKAVLGSMNEKDLDAWLSTHVLPRATHRTITESQEIKADLALSRARGCFITRGENVLDVMAVAAPIQLGSMIFGVAVAGPLNRMEQNITSISEKLLTCIQSLKQGWGLLENISRKGTNYENQK